MFVLNDVLTAVAVVTAQCLMVSGVCLCSSALVFTTRDISRQTRLSSETATTGKLYFKAWVKEMFVMRMIRLVRNFAL